MPGFKVSVVVPSFNEEGNVAALADRLVDVFEDIQCEYELIFVDDGSKDGTLNQIEEIRRSNRNVHYISFSRNFGHQNALKAGLDLATGDCVISMDGDLQHPPALITHMIYKWQEGYDVVYTRRLRDKNLPLFKRVTASFFYKTMNYLSDIEFEEGTADFRLMDRAVVDVFKTINEKNPFMRGLVKWVGFKQHCFDYQPDARFSGTTKYSFKKMFLFALDGITSFSIKPLTLAAWVGFIISMIGFIYGVAALFTFFFTNRNVSGWTSLVIGVMFIGGMQLLILGIIGEYIGKLFIQSKGRPNYIVRKTSLNEREPTAKNERKKIPNPQF
jgi:glycosyltransferase involved in cell wall biosynthesis